MIQEFKKKLREMLGIGHEDYFDFYYNDQDCLLDDFKEHLIEIGIEESGASKQHVNYVWQDLDKDKVVLPCVIFKNIHVLFRKTRRMVAVVWNQIL